MDSYLPFELEMLTRHSLYLGLQDNDQIRCDKNNLNEHNEEN